MCNVNWIVQKSNLKMFAIVERPSLKVSEIAAI